MRETHDSIRKEGEDKHTRERKKRQRQTDRARVDKHTRVRDTDR